MKNLLYIGNKLSSQGKNTTSIETLGTLLEVEGFTVKIASGKSNKLFRLLDMLCYVVKYKNQTAFVLIDTYSTINFYYALLVSQLCRLLNLKYIPILRGGNLPERLKNSPRLSKAIFKNAYKNIAPSQYIESVFKNNNYHNLVCIPNSIELKNYPFKNRNFDEVKLLWVRSFSKIYNPILAIKVLKALQEESINVSLCMVGPDNDGTLQEVKKYASKLNVNVKFTGKLTKAEWINLSRNYNIFINTTNFDNMPVSVIEAMALGLPVISTNVGGIPFLINNKHDGILVIPNDVEAFVETIRKLISNAKYAAQLTENARNKVEQFDWEIVKHDWFKVLQ